MPDPELEIRVGGGGGEGLSFRPLDKGGVSKRPLGPQFGFKNKGGAGPSAPLPWIRHWEIGYARHWISPELMHTRDSCHTGT